MNTHLHILEAYTNLYRVHKSKRVEEALKNLIALFMSKFIDNKGHLHLFFDDNWQLKSNSVSFGHDVECSWLLYEAAEVLNNKPLLKMVHEKTLLMLNAVNEGIDTDSALFYEFEPKTATFDTDKHWWPQAEALVGFYNGYQLTGNTAYLQQVVNGWEFIKNHLVDKVNGEWFWRVTQNGKPIESDEKAGFWKCPYHNSRACLEVLKRIEL
jgi:mannobiose 2-epimerase